MTELRILSPEEILDAERREADRLGFTWVHSLSDQQRHEGVAKAQARLTWEQLVEWLEEHNTDDEPGWLELTAEDWVALKGMCKDALSPHRLTCADTLREVGLWLNRALTWDECEDRFKKALIAFRNGEMPEVQGPDNRDTDRS